MAESLRSLEGRHPPGGGAWWNESWYFDFAAADGSIGGYVRIGLYPNQQRAWCWVYIVDAEGTIVVRDHDVPFPKPESLLARSDGLWCELICETPMEHWSIGVEAFGVRLDDPLDSYSGEIGTRMPVGLELEWETIAPAFHYPYPPEYPSMHYQHTGKVHGLILLGDETIEFDGFGERDHSYGDRDWWLFGWNWASAYFNSTFTMHTLKGDHGLFTDGYIWRGAEPLRVTSLEAESTFDDDGLLASARYVVNDALGVRVEPLFHAPIPLIDGTGRTSRFPRSLCRFTTDAGDVGYGWSEYLQVGRLTVG